MKKNFILFIIFLFVPLIISAQTYSLGDTNHDNVIDIVDALLVAQYYVNLDPSGFYSGQADVDANGDIDIIDALLIAQYYVGLITKFPGQTSCPMSGSFTYTLERVSNPTQAQQNAYNLITEAMDTAVTYYNCYTNISMHIMVYYDPSVPTAQANWYGPISFGGEQYMNYITAMHEMSHCAGVGTHSRWQSLIQNGIFTGSNATNQLRMITGNPQEELHADTQHFWPYGLNYVSEVEGEQDLINHCKIIVAIRLDLGI